MLLIISAEVIYNGAPITGARYPVNETIESTELEAYRQAYHQALNLTPEHKVLFNYKALDKRI